MNAVILDTDLDRPEALLAISPEARPGLYIDALDATLSRADAIATMLVSACGDLDGGYSVSQDTVADCLAALSGLIAQARTITRHTI